MIHDGKLKIKFKQIPDLSCLSEAQVNLITRRAIDKFKKIQALCHLQGKVPPSEVKIPLPSSLFNAVSDHSDHTYNKDSTKQQNVSTSDKGT